MRRQVPKETLRAFEAVEAAAQADTGMLLRRVSWRLAKGWLGVGCCLLLLFACSNPNVGQEKPGGEAQADGSSKETISQDGGAETVADTNTAESQPDATSEPATDASTEPASEPATEAPMESAAETPMEPASEPASEPADAGEGQGNEPAAEGSSESTADAGAGETPPEAMVEGRPESVQESSPETSTPGTIGSPCKQDSDCSGSGAVCIKETDTPSFPFPNSTGKGPPGGYCTIRCIIGGTACPAGSVCYVPGAASGTCLKICQAESDCRQPEGYTCSVAEAPSTKGCFPPPCAATQPGGTYQMTLGPSAPVNGCSSTPLTSGTMANFAVTINGTQIDLEFGSRPGSMLPTTWKLSGSLQGQQVEAANPSGCTTGCDGYVKGFFQGACLFNGTIEIKTGNCNHRYDFTAYKR